MNLNLTTSPPPFFFTTNLVLQITFDPVALHSVNSKKKKKKKKSTAYCSLTPIILKLVIFVNIFFFLVLFLKQSHLL